MVTFQQLVKDLKAGKTAPVYFLHGDEAYFIDEITDLVSSDILTETEKDFNMAVFYGKDADVDAIKAALNKYPMMAPKQVVILKEAQELKKLDLLGNYLEKPVPTTIFVMAHKHRKVDKRTKFYNILKKNAVIFESKKLYDYKIPQWIRTFMEAKGYQISEKASYLLTEYLGNDLKKIVNELEKLLLDEKIQTKVDVADIERNVGISKDYNVFELTKALGARNVVQTTRIINYFQANPKTNPVQMVIAILFNYFSKLYALHYTNDSKDQVAGKVGIPPFVMKEHIAASGKYNVKIPEIIEILNEYDLRSKGIGDSGTRDTELLKEMIYKILYI